MHGTKWRLEGFDTSAREEYPISGDYDSEADAVAAAENRMEQIEKHPPSVPSGEQEGLQDRIYVVRPDGSKFRVV